MKFLSILTVCKWRSLFPFWKSIFSPSEPDGSLGEELREAREHKGLSTAQVASRLNLSEAFIIALEESKGHVLHAPPLFDPGYGRLIAITYARFLHLDFDKITPLLPPPAPLRSSNATFVITLSPLQKKPKRPNLKREQHLTYSFSDVKSFLFKATQITVTLVILFYLWSFIRHISRVIL